MFNTLILSDDPMDGSRSLRKRKASSESEEKPLIEMRKRPRRGTSVEKLLQVSTVDGHTEVDGALKNSIDINSPRTRGSRRAGRKSDRVLVSVAEPRSEDNLTLIIRLPSEKLGTLDHERRKKRKRENERRRRERLQRPAAPEPEVQHFPGLPPHTLREQYLFSDSSGDDKPKPKPYGGILNDTEADTSRSFPQLSDMKKFEDARKKAEEQWKQKAHTAAAAETSRSTQKQTSSASKIKCIDFGGYEIDTWHAAPYPEEYTRNRVLYICEYCLKYMNSDFVAWRHKVCSRPDARTASTMLNISYSSNALPNIRQAMRFIVMVAFPFSRSMAAKTQSIVRIFASWPSYFSAQRRYTTMWTLSYSTS